MIQLTRLNRTKFWLNPELIEQLDKTPDTVITLTTGNNIIVTETPEQVAGAILAYRQKVMHEKGDAWTSRQ